MAKTKISEFSSTPSNNTDIDGINIAEGMAPSNVNNAIRELMSQLKDWQSGAVAQDMTVNGGITATGNAVLSADLAVAGKTTITGNATIGGAMTCTGSAVLSSTLAVSSNATIGGTLAATGATSLGAVTCSGAAVMSSTLSVADNVTLTGSGKKILNSSGNPILQQTGSVLQVVQATTASQTTFTSTSYADVGLSATITPTSSTSKILILVSMGVGIYRATNTADGNFRLVRGSTVIPSSTVSAISTKATGATEVYAQNVNGIMYLDSPATTNATTYKIQGALVTTANNCQMYIPSGPSTASIILMEIAA